MRRRDFITGIAGSAAAWPLAARAQQPERVRRIGVLHGGADLDDPERRPARGVLQGLQQLDWTDGRNLQIEARWTAADADNIRKFAAELAALAPDVILAGGTAVVGPLLQATRTVPVVFVGVADPVGAGLVDSLARPGGNATGFMQFEYGLSANGWNCSSRSRSVSRAAVLRNPAVTSGIGQFAIIQSVASSVGVEVSSVDLLNAGEIERAVAAFARSGNGGLIVTAGG